MDSLGFGICVELPGWRAERIKAYMSRIKRYPGERNSPTYPEEVDRYRKLWYEDRGRVVYDGWKMTLFVERFTVRASEVGGIRACSCFLTARWMELVKLGVY